ncbi:MAG: tRNA-dihydrouridine synthase family protein [Desulfobacterales bacterium]|nr:MAG: tRNA-dihydrouridine synthase family protein [Desulfobacterales bacterium]
MIYNLARYLRQPLNIGSKAIDSRLVLAPMTFLGHIAFRELVSRYGGCGLLFSEMCSAKTIPTENRYVSPYFRWHDAERRRLVCQIFGSNPQVMAHAARRIEKEDLFGVDINFGCANGSICRQNCGAALLQDPDLAAKIVEEVRKAVSIPLSVKFRTGWKDAPGAAVALAVRFESAGADALIFHPRVAPDRRSRPPRWEYIGMVKNAVAIPVFGNGDVFDRNDCIRIIEKTGCDGVALGRMAVAKPWIFAEWSNDLKPGPDIFREAALQLARLLAKHYDSQRAVRRYKRFAYYFSANFRFGHTFYSQVSNAPDMTRITQIIHRFFDQSPDLVLRPNLNFFQ